ncbi:MAG: XdhC family protein [Acidimicrobiia bacterium]|nr:XdhC family protein [Acidimicrobiia bacterium]MDH4309512.1 XdhC family protein [Acidimicrobiia bacterium]MDH5294971.1 XdhC family protein [Acidimicrobiia bacterium]
MNVLAKAARLQADGRAFALVTVTWTRGPSSGKQGSKAIIHPDGRVEGWLGGACAEPTVVQSAMEALSDGSARLLVLGVPDERPGVRSVSMACSSEGAMEVFVEPVLARPHLIVVGDSPMVDTLRRLAAVLGWRAESVTDPDAIRGLAGERSYVVVATQGHFDEPALEAVLATQASYVGLVASEKRASAVRSWLRDRGITEETLARVHAPAGVDLGHTEHHEIAVAVLAELVAMKASGAGAQVVEVDIPQLAVDPVCGMSVVIETAVFKTERGGEAFYFCAAGCLAAFERATG